MNRAGLAAKQELKSRESRNGRFAALFAYRRLFENQGFGVTMCAIRKFHIRRQQ